LALIAAPLVLRPAGTVAFGLSVVFVIGVNGPDSVASAASASLLAIAASTSKPVFSFKTFLFS